MAAASLDPRIIVLALGAGVLGFPDVLLDVAARRRSPLIDIAICVLAMAVVTAQALGGMLLARFVRKAARGEGDAPGAPRTDRAALVTLVVSLGVAFLVSACLLIASGAGAGVLGLLYRAAGIATNNHVIAVLATGAAVLPCARTLLRVFRREADHSHGAAAAASSSSAGTGRFANVAQAATVTVAAAFLLVLSGGLLYTQCSSLVGAAAVVVGAVVLRARFAFPRRAAHNAAGAGGRAAPTPAAGTRRVGGEVAWLAPYLGVVSFAALICGLVLTATYVPLQSAPDGAQQYP